MTNKQQLFVEHYLQCWNGTEAASRAGYKGNRNTLASVASENLRKPKVRAEIEKRLTAEAMSADEVLWRLAEQARGNIADFVVTEVPGGVLDMDAIREKGYLVKSLNWTKSGLRIELYDAQAALDKLARVHQLFKETHEHEGEIVVRFAGNVKPEEL